jgi:hypothetical protein
MTIQKINQNRNSNGVFLMSNDSCGWYAISRDNINMIVFYEGKWTFTQKDNVTRFYTLVGFGKRITQLLNRGY